MATTRCVCGEQIHYSSQNVGFNVRCRCGRTVTLPKIAAELPAKTPQNLADDERRSLRTRRQVLAVGVFLIFTIGAVLAVAMFTHLPRTSRQQSRPTAEEPP